MYMITHISSVFNDELNSSHNVLMYVQQYLDDLECNFLNHRLANPI